ncbi:hypothetical protein [uncultured Aquimarina sp.]|uniref:hypothetical protein n=1 Tax=uncultured Aquimarina sp. TaxID=575652 RepID=UPI00263152FC|nr:hypothetical protein [uncultured Aquimarina sp.]
MSTLSKIRSWFKSDYQKKTDNIDVNGIDDREFEWCIVGNIVDRHFYGMEKEVRRGTKQFRPGAKVYCMPEFGGMAHEEIRVIGKPRKQNRLINIVMKTKKIKNFRVQKVYSPKIQFDLGSHTYYWKNRRSENEIENLNEMVKYLNTLTEEINKKSI